METSQFVYEDLDVFSKLWWNLEKTFTPFQLASVVTLVYLVFLYAILSLPWYLLYKIQPSFLQKYKIQKERKKNSEHQKIKDTNPTDWQCFKMLLFNHFCVLLPLAFFTYPAFIWRNVSFTLPLPPWYDTALRIIFNFICEDIYFYFVHRWLHTEWAYKNIHYLHHEYHTPKAYGSSYAHPAEMIILGIGSVIGPLLQGGGHLWSFWVWMTVRQIEALDVHSGYDFPWNLSNWFPLYCGPDHHDFHHKTYSGNYASCFVVWDWLFGTDKAYNEARKRKKLLNKKKTN